MHPLEDLRLLPTTANWLLFQVAASYSNNTARYTSQGGPSLVTNHTGLAVKTTAEVTNQYGYDYPSSSQNASSTQGVYAAQGVYEQQQSGNFAGYPSNAYTSASASGAAMSLSLRPDQQSYGTAGYTLGGYAGQASSSPQYSTSSPQYSTSQVSAQLSGQISSAQYTTQTTSQQQQYIVSVTAVLFSYKLLFNDVMAYMRDDMRENLSRACVFDDCALLTCISCIFMFKYLIILM